MPVSSFTGRCCSQASNVSATTRSVVGSRRMTSACASPASSTHSPAIHAFDGIPPMGTTLPVPAKNVRRNCASFAVCRPDPKKI